MADLWKMRPVTQWSLQGTPRTPTGSAPHGRSWKPRHSRAHCCLNTSPPCCSVHLVLGWPRSEASGSIPARGPGSRPGPSPSMESGFGQLTSSSVRIGRMPFPLTTWPGWGGDAGVRQLNLFLALASPMLKFKDSELLASISHLPSGMLPSSLGLVTWADPVGALSPVLVSGSSSLLPSRCWPGSLDPSCPISKGSEHVLSWTWGPRGARPGPGLEEVMVERGARWVHSRFWPGYVRGARPGGRAPSSFGVEASSQPSAV